MAAKTSWHRYWAKLRHPMYSSRTNTEPIKRHFVNSTSGDKLRVPPLMPKRTIRTADKGGGRWDLSAHGLLHNIEVHGPRHWNRVTVEQKFDTHTHTHGVISRKCQAHLHNHCITMKHEAFVCSFVAAWFPKAYQVIHVAIMPCITSAAHPVRRVSLHSSQFFVRSRISLPCQ